MAGYLLFYVRKDVSTDAQLDQTRLVQSMLNSKCKPREEESAAVLAAPVAPEALSMSVDAAQQKPQQEAASEPTELMEVRLPSTCSYDCL